MLKVAADQLGNPMVLVISMVTGDWLFHKMSAAKVARYQSYRTMALPQVPGIICIWKLKSIE
jgi:hypothetical protein